MSRNLARRALKSTKHTEVTSIMESTRGWRE